ncbi:MAG TPA: c-type cytochrome [Candidatus Dormibacteraeota bacterium]|nr:c-type cytochrome [Candidatus Dormibacteraeota bacterium]
MNTLSRSLMLGLLLTACGAAQATDDVTAATRDHATRLAIGVCGSCHGPQGNSTLPKYPRLAGQNEHYLAAQLRSFRGQTRGDPDAVGYMWGMANNLDDATIDALAAYYTKQTALSGRAGDAALVARGREIYANGVAASGVPACQSCHGAAGQGMGEFPRLAGQHAQYVLKQLASFQSNLRNVAVMHGVAASLQTPQMEAVAAYLQTLR